MPFNIGLLSALAGSLVIGNDNSLEKLVIEKLETMGEQFLKDMISKSTGVDLIGRGKAALASGGRSEVNRARSSWLQGPSVPNLSGSGSGGSSDRIEKSFFKNKQGQSKGQKPTWSGSRREWLDANWRHTWESQPRDVEGRWKPGRLKHPYISKGARRIRSKRRAAARKAVREAWRDD
jgi:hypothetical protein